MTGTVLHRDVDVIDLRDGEHRPAASLRLACDRVVGASYLRAHPDASCLSAAPASPDGR
jgi:hypothetical protein